MGAAGVELPDTVTDGLVEWAYKRSKVMRDAHARHAGRRYSEAWRQRGISLARDRDSKVMKFLGLAAERLWQLQLPQLSRFAQEGLAGHRAEGGEFTEFSTFKQALLLADELYREADCDHEVFGWLYGAVAECVHGPL